MSPLALLVVFFVYGLAFFSLGLALALEAGRSPSLADARVLRPLAVFGLTHGLHEWLEFFALAETRWGVAAPYQLAWLRLGLLSSSFASLLAYGIQVLRPDRRRIPLDFLIPTAVLGSYFILAGRWAWQENILWIAQADALARYLLGIPGALLATLALERHSRQVKHQGRADLAGLLRAVSWGFGLYAFSQFFVSPADLFLAARLNTQTFLAWTGFPVQALRASLAVLITFGLIRGTQVVEKERRAALVGAQQARLDAMARVQEELVAREALRRELLRRTVAAQEEERSRLARELHDGTAQQLTALSLNLEALKHAVTGRLEANEVVDRIQGLCDHMARDLHRLVRDLRPAQLDDLGLPPALEFLADDFRKQLGLDVALNLQGTPIRLPSRVETALFRVAQESLTNAARHARTREVCLGLVYDENQVQLHVEDHGVGFKLQSMPSSNGSGWGLVGMQERVESVGGHFKLATSPGEGTRVEVIVPIQERAIGDGREGADADYTPDAG